ncbi:hypothetical protein FAES_3134 [Fibrella aestuarina BUZ 2]|uniref:Uncharacterized protein n=1 Tax=Fibrella aestuarina BUZ 2 TaxID=1166018 RepID=I0KAJ0_9BACT|nr:hypothetical protein FAES_3134 [Fibrella aestuarina BUZ 2]
MAVNNKLMPAELNVQVRYASNRQRTEQVGARVVMNARFLSLR